jgi:hypothetical protein
MSAEQCRAAGLAARRLSIDRFSQSGTSGMMKAVYGWLLGSGPRPACAILD